MNEIINNNPDHATLTDEQVAKLMAVIHEGAPYDETEDGIVVHVAEDAADKPAAN